MGNGRRVRVLVKPAVRGTDRACVVASAAVVPAVAVTDSARVERCMALAAGGVEDGKEGTAYVRRGGGRL